MPTSQNRDMGHPILWLLPRCGPPVPTSQNRDMGHPILWLQPDVGHPPIGFSNCHMSRCQPSGLDLSGQSEDNNGQSKTKMKISVLLSIFILLTLGAKAQQSEITVHPKPSDLVSVLQSISV